MNFTELDNFDTTVYVIDILDPVEGGINGIDNKQAKALANRTRWLYNRVNKIFFSFLTPTLVVPNGTVANVNGNTYAPNTYPLNFPDYTTPNDGVTRIWEISLSYKCAWTVTSGQFVGIRLYTVIATPTYSEIADNIRDIGNSQSGTWKVILSLPPNTRVALAVQNAATTANATFSNIQLTMKEL